MSFHPAQTFTFGEQPSATKWQYIWENDYALADGSAIAVNAIGASKLAADAITIGFAKITGGFSSASTTPTQVTGLSASVVIPSGGRDVEISVTSRALSNTAATPYMALSIWDGVPGVGTCLARQYAVPPFSGAFTNSSPVAHLVAPAPGAKTFNVGFEVQGGTGAVGATSTDPAHIVVKVI